MKRICAKDCKRFIAHSTGADVITVESVMVAEYEYLYALGFISGPEPKWTIFDPSDGKSVHSLTWDRAHLAREAGSRLDVPSSQVLAILDAELDYLKMQGVVISSTGS